nr:DUF2341 domain-containing protein [Kofleriaceae bacterium]
MRADRLVWLLIAGCHFNAGAASDASHGGSGDGAVVRHDAAAQLDGSDAAVSPARRKPITIHGDKIAGAQTDFPVWIELADAQLAARASSSGSDIFFTADDGSPLDFERTHWDASAPLLQAWVRVPALTQGSDTTIYVDYGDASRATQPDAHGVFRADFAAVWHLDSAPPSLVIDDSTGATPGSALGLGGSAQTAGQLGGGLAFDGSSSEQIAFTNPLTGNAASTVSAWVLQSPANHTSAVVTMGTAGTDDARFLYGGYASTASMGVGQFNDDWQAGVGIATGRWRLVHWVLEGGASKTSHLYVDGKEIDGSPRDFKNPATTTGTMGMIGNAPAPGFGGPPNTMNGSIDEVRLATVPRDPTWIATEFNNQGSASSFYAVGSEQPVP